MFYRTLVSSKGGQYGYADGAYPYCTPWYPYRPPGEGYMGMAQRMGTCLWDFIMGGGYMGTGSGSVRPSPPFCGFSPPFFCTFFVFYGGLYGIISAKF